MYKYYPGLPVGPVLYQVQVRVILIVHSLLPGTVEGLLVLVLLIRGSRIWKSHVEITSSANRQPQTVECGKSGTKSDFLAQNPDDKFQAARVII